MDPITATILAICGSLSVLALGACGYAAFLSDPARIRRALAEVAAEGDSIRNLADTLRTVEFPRLEATCEAVLERAEDRFDSAENKRKAVSGRKGGAANAAASIVDLNDASISREERRRQVRANMAGN